MTEPPFAKFEHGKIWWKGTKPTPSHMERWEAIRLVEQFEGVDDWFKPRAQEFVAALKRAIADHDHFYAENEDAELQYLTETEQAA